MNVSALLYGSGDSGSSSSSNHTSVSSGRTAWISASVIKQSRAASVTSDGNFSLTDGGSGSAAAAASTIPSSWLNLTSSYVDNSTGDRTGLPFYSNESDSFWSPRNTSTSGGLWNSSSSSGGGGSTSATPTGLSPMAIHFLAVGSLFVAVLILAVVNVYLHIRQQRRARLFAAPSPPPERHCSTRRRRSGRGSGGAAAAAAGEAEAAATERRIRMTVRMKPSKMFVV